MRLSKFNEIIKCGDEYLLYNLYSGAILALDECKIGDVLHPLDCENEKFVEWISYEIPDECKECKILPICMGGCPVLRRKEKKACPAVKYNYQKLLQLVNEWSKKEYEK